MVKLRLFSRLLSIVLQGFNNVVGTDDFMIDGRCGLTSFGYWLYILSACILSYSCIILSCIRWAGFLFMKVCSL